MADVRLSFEERKQVIKWYWKFENVNEVQRQWRREYDTEPPSRLTITRIRDKFEVHGTVCDVHKGHSGRPRTATSDESSTAVLELFQRSPNKSSRQGARESGVSASSVLRILKRAGELVGDDDEDEDLEDELDEEDIEDLEDSPDRNNIKEKKRKLPQSNSTKNKGKKMKGDDK